MCIYVILAAEKNEDAAEPEADEQEETHHDNGDENGTDKNEPAENHEEVSI